MLRRGIVGTAQSAESFAAKPKLIDINRQALSRGFALGQVKAAVVASR